MRMSRLMTCVIAIAVLAQAAAAVEVKLTVREHAKVARAPGIVTTGVPFAAGEVKDVSKLAVTSGGKALPVQFIRTVAWPDGSVRWALMDVQVPLDADGQAELTVTDAGGNPAPPQAVKVDQTPDAVTVSTGPMTLVVDLKKFNLFRSVKVDGKELITSAGRGLVLLKDGGGEVVAGAPTDVTVEQAGPLRAIVRLRGRYPGVHKDLLGYTVRVTACAGQRFVKVGVWLENDGGMGFRYGDDGGRSKNMEWFAFDGMQVELGLGLGGSVSAACEDATSAAGKFRVLQLCKQNLSGDKNRRGPFYTLEDMQYTVTEGDKELKKGARTDGIVALKGDAGAMTALVRDFWENYEKAISLDGTTLRLELWPTEGVWPRPRANLHSGEYFDKDIQSVARDGVYFIPGAVRKGHEFMLDFSGRSADQAHAALCDPLMALATVEYYAQTRAATVAFAPPTVKTRDKECNFKLASWTRMMRSASDPAGKTGLFQARQESDESQIGYSRDSLYWFGWLDYGDMSVPGRGPVSTHCDWPQIMLLNTIRFGDLDAMQLASAMMRHHMDVDQLWSDRDMPEIRGLVRADYNFPSFHCARLTNLPTVGADWMSGVVLYYELTGDPMALQCAQRNAEGLKAAWAYIAEKQPYGGPQGDMAANTESIDNYLAMYDLTADRKWVDEAMKLFNTNVTAKWKAQGPFLHDADNQIQSQDYVKDDMKYCYSIDSLCRLADCTGDEKVTKLLVEGSENEFPPTYFEAPLFLADLYGYVALKTGNKELLAKAADMFSRGFPESRCPPVYRPGNTTWSRHAAMTLRTGHWLQYAAWKMQEQ